MSSADSCSSEELRRDSTPNTVPSSDITSMCALLQRIEFTPLHSRTSCRCRSCQTEPSVPTTSTSDRSTSLTRDGSITTRNARRRSTAPAMHPFFLAPLRKKGKVIDPRNIPSSDLETLQLTRGSLPRWMMKQGYHY